MNDVMTDEHESADGRNASHRCGGAFAAIGRFCLRRRWWVVAAWTVLLVAGAVFGSRVFGQTGSSTQAGASESARGAAVLAAADPAGQVTAVLDGPAAGGPAARAAVRAAAADLARIDGVTGVRDGATSPSLRTPDGRTELVVVRVPGTDPSRPSSAARSDATVRAVAQRLREIPRAAPGTRVLVGGEQLLDQEIRAQAERDTRIGEYITLPITLVVMVLIFGGLLAAGLPVIGAVASIAGALLAMLGFSKIMPLDTSVLPVATVLGLGLSIDYALLMVNRFREERGDGATVAEAVERTGATAGRTIFFSALTVATSLTGLFFFASPIFRAVATAGVSVVVITLASGMTLIPALLAIAGGRIKPPVRRGPADDGVFARVVRGVQRRPLPVALVVGGLLIAAGLPFVTARAQSAGVGALPVSFQSRQVADIVADRFSGRRPTPITVVVAAPVARAQAYADDVRSLPGVAGVRRATPAGPGVSSVGVVPRGAAQGELAQRVAAELRDHRDGLRTWVTGDAASVLDFQHEIRTRAPLALGAVALATLLLLFLMTGSVLIPVKALAMNTLSLGASLGTLTLVFQNGWFHRFLGFTPTGGLETWIPVLVFAFTFGLSMDYEVFLLARIKEHHEQGHSSDRAVELGVQRSGRIITSAAALMVIVFTGFAAGRMLDIKEMGLALAVAVLVDATLVRLLLVPAMMTLFGERNWWSPRPLRLLHARFGLREHLTLPPLRPRRPLRPLRALPPLPPMPRVAVRRVLPGDERA